MLRKIRAQFLFCALKSVNVRFICTALSLFFSSIGKMNIQTYIRFLIWKSLRDKKAYLKGKHEKLFYKLTNKLRSNGADIWDFYHTCRTARRLNCSVGFGTYCGQNVTVGSPDTKIGKFCSIAQNVIIGADEHPLDYLSTSPFFYVESLGYRKGVSEVYEKPVRIGNDVWIGDNVFIKGGVVVEDGAVIAAGAVVVKNVPAYAIVGKVPAKIIKYRFPEETIQGLLETKWWDLPDEQIKSLPFKDPVRCIEILKNKKKE